MRRLLNPLIIIRLYWLMLRTLHCYWLQSEFGIVHLPNQEYLLETGLMSKPMCSCSRMYSMPLAGRCPAYKALDGRIGAVIPFPGKQHVQKGVDCHCLGHSRG
nr:hypothetical protein [uncultured Sanguibacteroides sp.]